MDEKEKEFSPFPTADAPDTEALNFNEDEAEAPKQDVMDFNEMEPDAPQQDVMDFSELSADEISHADSVAENFEELTEQKEEVKPFSESFAETDEDFDEEPEEVIPRVSFRERLPKIKKVVFGYALPSAFLLAALGLVFYYIAFAGKAFFHSDCTDTIMWAKASFDSGDIISDNFNYACFLPFGVSLIMQFFMGFFGLSMATHIAGMLTFLFLIVLFLCLMLKEAGMSYGWICSSAAIFLMVASSSEKLREIFWGHTIYYTLGMMLLFAGMFLLFRIFNQRAKWCTLREQGLDFKKPRKHTIICTIILLVFFVLCCTNGIAGITIFGLPMIAGLFMERLLDSEHRIICKRNRNTCLLLIALLICMVVGLKIAAGWEEGITASYQDAYSQYSAQGEWKDHFGVLVMGWLNLLGLSDLDVDGVNLASFDSIKALMTLFTAILISVMPIVASAFYPKYKGKYARPMHILIWGHWASTALILVGWICGKLSAANWRLTPIIGTSLAVSLLFFSWVIREKKPGCRVFGVLMIPIVLASCFNGVNIMKMKANAYKSTYRYELVDYLEQQNLNYGFATFWNANALTVISGDTVKVRSVNVVDTTASGLVSYDYQSEYDWYEPDTSKDGNYFLMLTAGENDTLINQGSVLLTEYTAMYNVQTTDGTSWFIYVYDHYFVNDAVQ